MNKKIIAAMIMMIVDEVQGLGNYALTRSTAINGTLVGGINVIANFGVKPLASILIVMFALMQLQKRTLAVQNAGLSATSKLNIEAVGIMLLQIGFIVFFIQSIDSIMWGIHGFGDKLIENINTHGFGGGVDVTMPEKADLKSIEGMLTKLALSSMELLQYGSRISIVIVIIQICKVLVFIMFEARMVQIFVMVALAPLPLSTLVHEEHRSIGINFIKSFAAVVLQGAVMVVVIMVYGVLVGNPAINTESADAIMWGMVGYAVLLVVGLVGSSALAKMITNAM